MASWLKNKLLISSRTPQITLESILETPLILFSGGGPLDHPLAYFAYIMPLYFIFLWRTLAWYCELAGSLVAAADSMWRNSLLPARLPHPFTADSSAMEGYGGFLSIHSDVTVQTSVPGGGSPLVVIQSQHN